MARKTLVLALLAIPALMFFGCDKVTAPKPVPDSTVPVNYTLVWADEFDQASSTPNPDNWGYDLGYGGDGWGNDEWQLYSNDQQNVRVENGNLVISAVWDSANFAVPGKRNGSVTSARINTKNKFSFKFGKAEARIKAPTDKGMWPAFWMLGNNIDTEGWPGCGEIDIMEISPLLHDDRTTLCTMHWGDDEGSQHYSYGTFKQLSEDLSNDYHEYAVEWDEQRIVGKIDDIIYFVKVVDPATMDAFLKEFFLILNVAVGGSLGGAPDASTNWPQNMYVDWVRVSKSAESLIPVETYGIFTDTTPVDDGLTVGLDAEIYVWENTLTAGTIPPYEGANGISFSTAGIGWFGAGISSNIPLDLSGFAEGNIKFMIKIPANVRFKIGINDAQGHENYVIFPANQTAYGLVRNGEWGQAVIPVSEIKGNVDLEMLSYEFIILEQDGAQCEFALDDIYWDGGGATASSVSFNADSYASTDLGATISVNDLAAANSNVTVTVSNGRASINVAIALNALGVGSAGINFGDTNDDTDTIAITAGNTLSVSYTDTNGTVRTDSATITGGAAANAFGIYTDDTPVDAELEIGVNAEIYVWENTLIAGTIPPYEGSNVISWNTNGMTWFGAGIASNSPLDLSTYLDGNIKLMIKIPANVRFKIGINDTQGHENYVIFPANQTAYGLVRNGEWGQAVIPVAEIKGNVNLQSLSYTFMILEENGTQCQFAIDDIYWEGAAPSAGRVSIHAKNYDNDNISLMQ